MRFKLALAVMSGVLALFLGISFDTGAQGTSPADSAATTSSSVGTVLANPPQPRPNPQYVPGFHGVINLDVRNSKSDWTPFTPQKAPQGAPNFLFILYDDTGLAAWSPYGGRINMPTLDRLAANGLTYTQWHTPALCSPSRSTILTGRNHHLNGMASITESASGFPGSTGRLPEQSATIGQILQDAGWSTFWVGKNHNVAEQDVASGATRKQWPLQKGFDRYYGFIGGETNQWYPDLVEDNRFVDQSYGPEQGYHLSKDLVDHAIEMLRDQKATNPSRPWFMWFNPGANHAPHQAPQEYIDKYKGKFDDGYEAYRSWVLQRMVARGILPKGTQLTPLNPLPKDIANPLDNVRPWDTLSPDEKKLFSRLAEVYAGFSEYTDAQIGRLIDYLQQTGQLDNTVIFYAADNGASGEGGPNGSVNENKFFNGFPDTIAENMSHIGELGGPNTYEHYPTGWAVAFSTPFQMFKRYSQFAGGTADPLVISWPKGIKARGEIRNQYHHSTDIVPTILEIAGLEMPKMYRGVEQYPLSGVSMRYTFDSKPNDPTRKRRQYYEMLGTRGLWEDGWKVASVHAPLTGRGKFDQDAWELYHVDVDRAESKDLSKQYPDKLRALVQAWFDEADKNHVLPLDDRSALELLGLERPSDEPPHERYIYYPDTAPVPEAVAVNIRNRSYRILANVDITDADASGVVFAHGSRFGGHTLFLKERKVHYVYNFLGIKPEQEFVSKTDLKPGKHTIGVEFTREKEGEHGESIGTTKLYIDDQVVAQGPMRTQPGKFTLSGDGLCVGYDSGDAVSQAYASPAKFKGGKIFGVGVTVEKAQYEDLNKEAQRMLMKE
ncbi:arylsulfatase [Paraburkholderia azotifigens]|uniref:Arylsulfatase n=1 Tax=Paraburkholderia azotifigens TaxID=2057004 RepID=A0A5C6V7W6_9BURK|nr:arylsulfatase [Paraburkholderia azotifigens]TXC79835.1 arylsulfatase [Paraburkholderia azotifigens]